MSSAYAKREIYRVMSWGESLGIDTKFERLEHYFKIYFDSKKKERQKREFGKIYQDLLQQ